MTGKGNTMKTIEYGTGNKNVIILLHGGGLSWWNYREEAELLQKNFHVVIPILDGHAESDRDFTSIEENASELIAFIDEKYGGSVALIGGLSLGGQILVEMLSQRPDICNVAIIESALVIPMKMTHCLVKPMLDMSYGLIKQEWFSKLQFKSLKMKKDLYEVYYRDSCKITKENMISFLQANSKYSVDERITEIKAKVYIYVGQREQGKMIRSAKLLNQRIPKSVLKILPGMYHGEYSLNHARDYVEEINEVLDVYVNL